MSSSQGTRIAVVGASGIGKHHAKWWALEGAEVCAFVGTSEESVGRAREGLQGLFDFTGRGYTDLDEMLERERPDIVDVCSPPRWHFAHAAKAIDAGCHVLCEKPLVYDPALSREELLAQARDLVTRAEHAGKRFGVCTQYVVCARMVRNIWKQSRSDRMASKYRVHLASPAKGREPDPARVWVDLGPHPISGLQELSHDGEILWDTVRTEFSGYNAIARFTAKRVTGEPIECELITGNTTEPPPHVREVTLDDCTFVIGGENDADGVYCARIDTEEGAHVEPDFMRVLIGEFLAGEPAADGNAGIINLDWLLRILEIAREQN
ncbi:MAG: Gfo/Idh/MocA family oxidoreductase [Candidatus Hydrogenedentes bacterium]|nr:Gfo/Idh/MocA family oxidoreductase [Candidatus Hydrogenedentota bacterium]